MPFPPPAASDIIIDKPLRRFLQLLRFKAEEEELEPDIRRSIRATIRSGGMAQMVFRPRRRIQEYLLFIDGSRPQGMLYALYQYLSALMEAEGIPVTVFYYDADFLCSSNNTAALLSVRSIADDYPAAIPVILGDGSSLMHPLGGVLRHDLLEQLRRWDAVLFVTPTPRHDWSARERALAMHFMIAPADAVELGRLGQDFKAGRKTQFLSVSNLSEAPDFKSVAGLRHYFGGDEALFHWLCALCIYPKPRWELLIAFGKAVLAGCDPVQDLRYDQLLLLCRIPWLAEGSFPQRLRLELLKVLTVSNEVAARAALVSLMQNVRSRYAGDYIFSAEQKLEETLSRFVLYGHNPQRFSAHASSVAAFNELQRNGEITDMPARKYLQRKADGSGGWQTPLQVAPDTFIEQETQRKRAEAAAAKRRASDMLWTRRFVAGAAIVALVALWLFLNLSETARSAAMLQRLFVTDSTQPVALSYKVQRNFSACDDTVKTFSVLPATLNAGGKPYGMPYDRATQTISCILPLSALGSMAPTLSLGVSGSPAPVTFHFDQMAGTGSIYINCRRYSTGDQDSSGETGAVAVLPAYLNEIWVGKTNNRLLNINLNTRMIYYSTGAADTWGTSRIENVLRTSDGGYRIVANVYPGYMVFFLKNVSKSSFRLAFCQQRYDTRTDALIASENCSTYDDMRLYYEQNRDRIYLPAVLNTGDRAVPVAKELEKLRTLVNEGFMDAPGPVIINYTQQDNGSYLTRGTISDAAIRGYLGDLMQNIARLSRQSGVVVEKKNPFQRPYLLLKISYGKYPDKTERPSKAGTQELISPDSLNKLIERNSRRQDSLEKRMRQQKEKRALKNGGDYPPAAK